MNREQRKRLFLCGHQWCREIKEKHNVNYHIQFGLCLQELLRQKEENKEFSLF